MPSGMHARPGGVLGRDGPPRSSGVCAPASGALFGWVLTATLIVSALVLLPVTAARADIVYLYDELGRLVRVILPDGEAASYHYDAVGNIRSITRESGVAQTTTVASVSPASADRATTTTVTISGANLSGASVTTSAPERVTVAEPKGASALRIRSNVSESRSVRRFWMVTPGAEVVTEAPLKFAPLIVTVVVVARSALAGDTEATVVVWATPLSRVIERMLPTAS